MRSAAAVGRLALAVAAAAALLLGLAAVFGSPTGRAWGAALTAAVAPWEGGPADLVRGALRWVAPPLVLAVVVAALIHAVREGRRRAAVVGVVLGLGSFATTQAIKLWLLPFPRFGAETGRELSGHAAMAASAVLVLVVCAAPHRRRLVAAGAAVGAFAVSFGAVVARWHDSGEVVVALAVGIGWGLVGCAFLAPSNTHDGGRRSRWLLAVLLVALPAAAAWALVTIGQGASGRSPVQTVLATALAVLAATAALTLVALAVADRLAAHRPRGAGARAPTAPVPEPYS